MEKTKKWNFSVSRQKTQKSSKLFLIFIIAKGRFTRDQGAREIVTTERTYVDQLEVLLKYFIEPTLEKGLITSPSIISMFKHIRVIVGLHKELLREMEERVQNMSNATQLGDLFIQLVKTSKPNHWIFFTLLIFLFLVAVHENLWRILLELWK